MHHHHRRLLKLVCDRWVSVPPAQLSGPDRHPLPRPRTPAVHCGNFIPFEAAPVSHILHAFLLFIKTTLHPALLFGYFIQLCMQNIHTHCLSVSLPLSLSRHRHPSLGCLWSPSSLSAEGGGRVRWVCVRVRVCVCMCMCVCRAV